MTCCGSGYKCTVAGMRVPTLTDTFRLTRSAFCSLMTELILVRCSVVNLAEPAAPCPVVARFCSELDLVDEEAPGLLSMFDLFAPLFAGLDSGVAPPGPRWPMSDFGSDFGTWPVVSFALPDLLSGVAWPLG